MIQTILLAGLPWTIESEEPLPSKFDVFLLGPGTGAPSSAGVPIMHVHPEPAHVGEKAPWDPTITHDNGIVRYRGQEVSSEGRLPLDRIDARAAPGTLGAERALLGWMCTRMTCRGEGLFLHAASIRGKEGAWLLIGGPSVGKSTACRLAGDRSLCTNVTALREQDGRWFAYPTPMT